MDIGKQERQRQGKMCKNGRLREEKGEFVRIRRKL